MRPSREATAAAPEEKEEAEEEEAVRAEESCSLPLAVALGKTSMRHRPYKAYLHSP